jgi:PAN domain
MTRVLSSVVVCLAVLFGQLSPHAHSAALQSSASPDCKILIAGVIEKGDLSRLQTLVNAPGFFSDHASFEGDDAARICLNSGGGSFAEAAAIAVFVSELGIGTVVRDGESCIGPCALVFMAGRSLGTATEEVNRRLHIRGRLGFQRPSLETPVGQRVDAFAAQASFETAMDAIAKLMTLGNGSIEFLSNRRIRYSLFEEMLKNGGTDYFYIDTVDRAGRWGIDVFGYAPPRTIGPREVYDACENFLAWANDESNSFIYETTVRNQSRDPVSGPQAVSSGRLGGGGFSKYSVRSARDPTFSVGCTIFVRGGEQAQPVLMLCAVNEIISKSYGPCEDARDLPPVTLSDIHLFPPDMRLTSLVTASAAPVVSQSKVFREYVNYDSVGLDIEKFQNVTASECQNHCLENSTCASATYDRWNRFCVLKSRISTLLLSSKSSVWLNEGVVPDFRGSVPEVLKRKGKVFPNKPYKTVSADSFDTCALVCLADRKCMGFNLSLSGRCGLIDTPSEYHTEVNSVIGYKMEAP